MERLRKWVVSMSKKNSSLGKTVRGGSNEHPKKLRGGIVYLIDRNAFLAFLDCQVVTC
jgi:hypothetical protein